MRVLREDPATRDIPVVALTAHAMPADLARSQAAGFAAHLTKPLQLERMLAVLDAHAG
jgi:CheY-like chemotaxis protein